MMDPTEIMITALENGGTQIGGKLHRLNNHTLEYHDCTRMILDIGSQIEILRENGWGVLYISAKDITVTSDGSYMLTPMTDLFSCDEKGMILIDRPFKYDETYMAPELKPIDTLPSKVYYTSAYFSLKSLVLKVLGIDTLFRIYPTKLYFLIERCSCEDPQDRIFLFI